MPAGRDLKALWQQQPEQRLLPLAGDLLAQLHNAGLTHGDCKWSNLFWCDERLYLVDLESVSRARDEARGRDLARFTVNAEDLGVAAGIFAGFIDAYCVGTQAKPDDVVALMRPELLRLRDRHRKKYGERGAQLV
jgi:tRNA A-37 threonylcarbamoyl transferase component Bud32